MSKLNIVNVNNENIFYLVKDIIYSCVVAPIELDDTKFHHQISIKNLPSALEHGLLSKTKYVHQIEKRELTKEEILRGQHEFCVNGLDHISISTMDMDFDRMYRGEDVWETYSGFYPDIIISKDVKAHMSTWNYYNEFIVKNEIPVEMFNSIDIKIFRLYDDHYLNYMGKSREERIKLLLEYYEGLRIVALKMKEKQLNIPLREVSEIYDLGEDDKALTLDVDKVIEMPKLILK